jgi:hypothetical protein
MIIINCKVCFGQNYYRFTYTNIPDKDFAPYSTSRQMATGWLYSGHYSSDNCKYCTKLSTDSKTKKEMIDSLSKVYDKYYQKDILRKVYIPGNSHHFIDSVSKPYLIETIYKINNKQAEVMVQVKIIFSSTKHGDLYEIYDIQIYPPATAKKFDNKLVMTSYKKTLQEERKFDNKPPEIKQIKD